MRCCCFLLTIAFLQAACYKPQKDRPVTTGPDSTVVQRPYKEKARAVYDTILRFFDVPATHLFRENYPAQGGDPQYAYFWSHTTMFTAAICLKSLGFSDPSFQKCTDGMEDYWDAGRLPVAYQSAVVSNGRADRYYDDNATAGLDLVEAYKVTGQQQFFDKAESCLLFTMSGESADQGGGLFWCEQFRTNDPSNPGTVKAANATAFAATLALKLYQIGHKQAYLDFATRLYKWNKQYMQDPNDHLFWNDVNLSGVVNRTKWAYNVGQMISAACLFYQVTSDNSYLTDAQQMAAASYNYFTRLISGQRFFPANDPWFTVILLRGYLDLYGLDKNENYIQTVVKNLDYAWQHSTTPDGLFLEDWAGTYRGRYYWIINQAAMVEAFARISQFKKE